MRPLAGVAQLVEQRIRNAKVDSSSPSIGTKLVESLNHCIAHCNTLCNKISGLVAFKYSCVLRCFP